MSGDHDGDGVGYVFDDLDHVVLAITQQLIAKVLDSPLLDESERTIVLAIGQELAQLPDRPSSVNASISLIGPRRMFGNHEIYHHWSVEIEGDEIRVDSGGHFYRPSTGGDSFTSFRWVAWPGSATECQDFSSQLLLVDDAKPFGTEIEELDLSEPGYQVSVAINGEDVRQHDDLSEEDLDEEDQDIEGNNYHNLESSSSELTVCLWAFLDADLKLIYAVSGRIYRLSGDDDTKLRTLRELSRHDFNCVARSKVPNRFCIKYTDGTEKPGLATVTEVFDPNAMLFEELLKELEQRVPPLADFVRNTQTRQNLPEDPLCIRTIVYEDAHGNCRAIVDEFDKAWLLQQIE